MKERTLYFSVPVVKYPRLTDLLKGMLTTLTQRFIARFEVLNIIICYTKNILLKISIKETIQ